MKGLTKRQAQVLGVIEDWVRNKGYPPSVRDIGRALGLSSAAGVHKHIKAIVAKGYLQKDDHLSRSLRVVDPGSGEARMADSASGGGEMVELPLVGYVAAGQPIEAIEQRQETLAVPTSLLGSGRTHFVLQVRGDSMIEESILDGDYVIIESRDTARDGEVVVALLHGQEATLKRFYREHDQVRLQPANAALSPIRVPGDQVRVQGVVVGVWRRF